MMACQIASVYVPQGQPKTTGRGTLSKGVCGPAKVSIAHEIYLSLAPLLHGDEQLRFQFL